MAEEMKFCRDCVHARRQFGCGETLFCAEVGNRDLVTGDYLTLCSAARYKDTGRCGKEGKFFERRLPPPDALPPMRPFSIRRWLEIK